MVTNSLRFVYLKVFTFIFEKKVQWIQTQSWQVFLSSFKQFKNVILWLSIALFLMRSWWLFWQLSPYKKHGFWDFLFILGFQIFYYNVSFWPFLCICYLGLMFFIKFGRFNIIIFSLFFYTLSFWDKNYICYATWCLSWCWFSPL